MPIIDGITGATLTLEQAYDLFRTEFMDANRPNEPSNINIPIMPDECGPNEKAHMATLMQLSDDIGEKLAEALYYKEQTEQCLQQTDTEYMMIIADNMQRLLDA